MGLSSYKFKVDKYPVGFERWIATEPQPTKLKINGPWCLILVKLLIAISIHLIILVKLLILVINILLGLF